MQKGQSSNRMDDGDARTLIIAVIEQAVIDFKQLAAAGRILDGKVNSKGAKVVPHYRTDPEVQALLDFFNSRVLDEWICVARIRINPNQIRKKLGLPCQSYDIHCP